VKFEGELCALCFSDDPWATRPAVELLACGFTAIKPEVLTVKPSDVGAKTIGHFGFFRPNTATRCGATSRNGSRASEPASANDRRQR
jgi:predicted alpha/beta hydrolase